MYRLLVRLFVHGLPPPELAVWHDGLWHISETPAECSRRPESETEILDPRGQ